MTMWMVPLMQVVMIMWAWTIHLWWVSVVGRTSSFIFFLWWLLGGIYQYNM